MAYRLHWTPSNDWHSAIQKKTQISAVEFPVLLPGLLVGISPLPRHIEAFSRNDGLESHTEPATVYLTAARLIVHFKNTLAAQHSANADTRLYGQLRIGQQHQKPFNI